MSEKLKRIQSELPSGPMWVTGGWLKKLIDALLEDRAILANGSGNEIPTASGRWFQINGGAGGRSGRVPWNVRFASNTLDEEGAITAVNLQVELDSWLMGSEEWDDKITVTGLGSPFAIEEDQKVWLEITMDANGGPITAAAIVHDEVGSGTDWDNFPTPIKYNSSDPDLRSQIKYRHLLAEFVDPGDWTGYPWTVLQFPASVEKMLRTTTNTHLIICRKCYEPDGAPVRVLAPWFAPSLDS